MPRYKNKLWLMVLLLTLAGNSLGFSASDTRTYRQTHRLLSQLGDLKSDSDKLSTLFKVADPRIDDLIQALDDGDREISRRAQIVIRYSGNAKGMKALIAWYSNQPNEYPVAGPIPLPLSDWDYKFIDTNLMGKPLESWEDLGVRYIYALALDGSPRAKALLHGLKRSAGTIDDSTVGGRAIRLTTEGDAERVLIGQRDLAKLILENAFFITAEDRQFTSAKLLGLNGTKDRALIELYINRGRLAEEWYHIVLSKHGQGWKFFSITQVAVS